MGHASQQSTRAALLAAIVACSICTGTAQTSLQQAMFPSSALPSVSPAAPNEDTASAPPTSIASALQQLAGQAAVVFTGSVAGIAADANGGAQVRFVVEQGIRGVASGAGYTMKVSAWAGGAERFYPGERALFLLTAASVSGYSAPVMGERGVVPLSGDTLVGNLDLRWIATDVQREIRTQSVSANVPGPAQPAEVFASAVPAVRIANQLAHAATPANAFTLADVHAIDRDLVLDLVRTGLAAGQTR